MTFDKEIIREDRISIKRDRRGDGFAGHQLCVAANLWMGMMPRLATEEDIPAIVEMGRAFHEMAAVPMGYSQDAISRLVQSMIDHPDAVVIMSDTGVIGGQILPAYCDPEWKIAVELFWWANGGGMKLLRAFEGWAKDIGAHEIRMSSMAALPRAERILTLAGYRPAELSFSKEA
jgi:hypothetical protein